MSAPKCATSVRHLTDHHLFRPVYSRDQTGAGTTASCGAGKAPSRQLPCQARVRRRDRLCTKGGRWPANSGRQASAWSAERGSSSMAVGMPPCWQVTWPCSLARRQSDDNHKPNSPGLFTAMPLFCRRCRHLTTWRSSALTLLTASGSNRALTGPVLWRSHRMIAADVASPDT